MRKGIFMMLIVAIVFIFNCTIFADEEISYSADGFEIDNGLLMGATDSFTEEKIDTNGDLVITLDEWKQLEKLVLNCSKCDIQDWSALNYLNAISELTIFSKSSEGLEQLEGLDKVHTLKVNCADLNDLTFLDAFSGLRSIDLSGCGISDASSLVNLDYLSSIDLTNNKISDFSWINDIDCTKISLKGNDISIEDALRTFINLDSGNIIDGEEGKHKKIKLEYPTCDIVNTSGIKIEIEDTEIAMIVDESIYFRNSGTTTLTVSVDEEPILTYTINVIEATEGTYCYMLKGDADNNDVVDAEDALNILKISAKLQDYGDKFSIRKNDFDNNYKIDANDALSVLKTAAKLEEIRTIDDPENFYDTVNYINGYPEYDFINGYLHRDVKFTIEEGKTWDIHTYLEMYKYENSNGNGNRAYAKVREDGFDKLYWELRWLVEDAKKNAQIEAVSEDVDLYEGFTGYRYDVVTYSPCLDSMKAYINVFINENNEMYFSVIRRFDLYRFEEEDGVVYKYTGEIPGNLKFESIASYYENYKSE